MELSDLKPGTEVNIVYIGHTIKAKIVTEPRTGWVMVEQITDYEDARQPPRFEAAVEYVSLIGEPLAPRGPLGRASR